MNENVVGITKPQNVIISSVYRRRRGRRYINIMNIIIMDVNTYVETRENETATASASHII